MARLQQGERDDRRHRIFRLLQRHCWGLRESEIAEEMGIKRRTINSYLRELQEARQAEKEGWLWFAKR